MRTSKAVSLLCVGGVDSRQSATVLATIIRNLLFLLDPPGTENPRVGSSILSLGTDAPTTEVVGAFALCKAFRGARRSLRTRDKTRK